MAFENSPFCVFPPNDLQFGKKEMRILMVGLDAAGKTTILYKLKLGEGRNDSFCDVDGGIAFRSWTLRSLACCSPLLSLSASLKHSCNDYSYDW